MVWKVAPSPPCSQKKCFLIAPSPAWSGIPRRLHLFRKTCSVSTSVAKVWQSQFLVTPARRCLFSRAVSTLVAKVAPSPPRSRKPREIFSQSRQIGYRKLHRLHLDRESLENARLLRIDCATRAEIFGREIRKRFFLGRAVFISVAIVCKLTKLFAPFSELHWWRRIRLVTKIATVVWSRKSGNGKSWSPKLRLSFWFGLESLEMASLGRESGSLWKSGSLEMASLWKWQVLHIPKMGRDISVADHCGCKSLELPNFGRECLEMPKIGRESMGLSLGPQPRQ